jgi:hypothetical protein
VTAMLGRDRVMRAIGPWIRRLPVRSVSKIFGRTDRGCQPPPVRTLRGVTPTRYQTTG